MKRLIQPELLDELPANDLRAIHSRADLRRLNWLMKHVPIVCAAFKTRLKQPPAHLAELGAGDGSLLLDVARQMHASWPSVRVSLVDRQRIVSAETLAHFRKLGWAAEVIVADAFDWLEAQKSSDVIFANLFLHHFANERLSELLRLIADRTGLFLACETRRTWLSFAVSRSLRLIGCNSVTSHDAILSMRAGFRDQELSALWQKTDEWQLEEHCAIAFTHLFIAQRRR
jgi:hypothetical protein